MAKAKLSPEQTRKKFKRTSRIGSFVKGYKYRWETNLMDGATLPLHVKVTKGVIDTGLLIKRRMGKGRVGTDGTYTKEQILAERKRLGRD